MTSQNCEACGQPLVFLNGGRNWYCENTRCREYFGHTGEGENRWLLSEKRRQNMDARLAQGVLPFGGPV